MRPTIISETRRPAIGQFLSLSLVTVPKVFAINNLAQFPSTFPKVANFSRFPRVILFLSAKK